MCIGGIAVIAHGVKRNTHDVDVAVAGAGTDPVKLLATLRRHGIVPRIRNAAAFARSNLVILVRHRSTGVDLDVSLAWLSFEREALAGARSASYGSVRAPVARPEDLVIYKVLAARPLDLQDAESLLVLHRASINVDRVRRVVSELGRIEGVEDRPGIVAALLTSTRPERRTRRRMNRRRPSKR